MKKEEIHLADIQRILFGQAPPEFLLEVFIRTLVIYIVLLFIVRWLGKRMSGQLTIMEMSVMLTLGAIVSVPMQMPDRGIIQGVVLLLCAVGFQRGISLLGFRSGRIEDILQGKSSLLVKDGVMQIDQMAKDRVSKQQLFSELRQQKIFNLGIVDRIYLEACGLFSIIKSDEPRPGLPVLPPDDQDILKSTNQATTATPQQVMLLACVNCGYVKPKDSAAPCEDCGHDEWVNAVN
ncbi:YetF domain-containing protein [Mucilaginibacter sp. PAMB04168]|uniref:DUF421 domain-containing protein n=1 Tax=Mucilaginibacter sp. PAMB04168 TaxID=3138567 RepID=UPI0031F62286